MRIKVVLEVACGLAALSACGDARPRAPISDGERLYTERCTGCHAAYEPHERQPAEWEAAVAKMERWKKVTLSEGERSLILGYLTGAPALAESSPAAASVMATGAAGPSGLSRQALLQRK